jgi:hypothetical protein
MRKRHFVLSSINAPNFYIVQVLTMLMYILAYMLHQIAQMALQKPEEVLQHEVLELHSLLTLLQLASLEEEEEEMLMEKKVMQRLDLDTPSISQQFPMIAARCNL